MPHQHAARSQVGRLIPSEDVRFESPPVIHQGTTLGEIRVAIENHHYILAANDLGQIVGIVSCQRMLEHLESKHDRERGRWESMYLGAFVSAEVGAGDRPVGQAFREGIECITVMENDSIVAIAAENDVFLSLQWMEPTLAAARCDPLTGLMNRLGYERRLAEEWARAARTGVSIGVIVLDLDDFKTINDRHGHLAGDQVLRKVGHILEKTLRSYDVVARYGGDEFVALCLDCQPRDIEIPITRFQETLSASTIKYGEQELHVTASIGAAVRHDEFYTSTPSELFAAADECVYQSKRAGTGARVIEFSTDGDEMITAVGVQGEESARRMPSTVSVAGDARDVGGQS
ncbi:MAG: GGDEF domain-containing protein [Pirellulales bacterium]|nr:GGDEF domain-containing protein [Pirellulales bacterium]